MIEPPLSYLAGLFDGEGSICIYESGKFCVLRMSISMRHRIAIHEFAYHFKLKAAAYQREGGFMHVCQASGRHVGRVASELLPHLIVKHGQAKLAIEYAAKFCQRFAPRLTPEQKVERSAYVVKMASLNGTLNWNKRFSKDAEREAAAIKALEKALSMFEKP